MSAHGSAAPDHVCACDLHPARARVAHMTRAYLLTPEPDGSVKVSTAEHDRVRWYEPMPLALGCGVAMVTEGPAVVIDVVRYRGEVHRSRRERRQAARARGRRRAVAVPVGERWDVRVGAHPDVPAGYVRAFVGQHAVCVMKTWARKARIGR